MLDRPWADQYSVVTRPRASSLLEMGNPTATKGAWDQALRYRLQNEGRS